MCYGCYEEAGKPALVNAKTSAAARLVDRVYNFSCVGGNAHVVIDDWNLDDRNISEALNDLETENVHQAGPEQLAAERACLEALLGLSFEERVSALALHEGFLPG